MASTSKSGSKSLRKKRSSKSAHAQKLANARKREVEPALILADEWEDPADFAAALSLHIKRHGECCYRLWKAITEQGDQLDPATLVGWCSGRKSPRAVKSLEYLSRVEARYRLPVGYFAAKLPHPSRSFARPAGIVLSVSEQRRFAWHLPADFDRLPEAKQQEILTWVRNTIIAGATEYRRFQAAAIKVRYAVRFRTPMLAPDCDDEIGFDPDAHSGRRDAPASLSDEMASLVGFKTATLTAPGYQRRGVWGSETARQKIEHLALMLGALSASPNGPNKRRRRRPSRTNARPAGLLAGLGLVCPMARTTSWLLHVVGSRHA